MILFNNCLFILFYYVLAVADIIDVKYVKKKYEKELEYFN